MPLDRGQLILAGELSRRGEVLLRIARDHLADTLLGTPPADPTGSWSQEPWLFEPGAVFITLRRHGELRGCVGSIEAVCPLIEDVHNNTAAAATRDTRFTPLEATELDAVRIEISLLEAPEPIAFTSEADALAQLRPGADGVVLQHGARRATFLPQVWESLPTPEAFTAKLKTKAGLAADFWDADVRLERYRVHKWCESEAAE